MKKQINDTVEKLLDSAKKGEMPKVMKDAVLDGVNKSQEANTKWIALLKDVSKDYEGLAAKAGANARAINDRILDNAAKNTQAAFDHAAAAIKTGDATKIAQGQFEFARTQLGILNDQQAELFDLSSKIASDMFDAANEVANATVERFKTAV